MGIEKRKRMTPAEIRARFAVGDMVVLQESDEFNLGPPNTTLGQYRNKVGEITKLNLDKTPYTATIKFLDPPVRPHYFEEEKWAFGWLKPASSAAIILSNMKSKLMRGMRGGVNNDK